MTWSLSPLLVSGLSSLLLRLTNHVGIYKSIVIYDQVCIRSSLGLASGFGVLLVLIGAFLMALGYGTISQCMNLVPYANCWDPFHVPYYLGYDFPGADYQFFAGVVLVAIGGIILVGPNLGRSLRGLKGGRSGPEK